MNHFNEKMSQFLSQKILFSTYIENEEKKRLMFQICPKKGIFESKKCFIAGS